MSRVDLLPEGIVEPGVVTITSRTVTIQRFTFECVFPRAQIAALQWAAQRIAEELAAPAQPAVTDEMIEAALNEWIRQRMPPVDADARPAMRAALVAAMEAKR